MNVKTYETGSVVKHKVVSTEVEPNKWVIEFCDETDDNEDEVQDAVNQATRLGMRSKIITVDIPLPRK